MPEPIHPSKLEEVMKEISNAPEPDAEFMNSLRARFIAEGHASAKKNQETQMKQKNLSQRLTWALAVLVLVALVVLFTRPTVVNALKSLFGYVPNVGIINQSSDVRMLDEPVTLVRDNYTLTIEQAVLTNDMSAVVYSYMLPPDYVIPDTISTVNYAPFLTLPDGTRLDIERARHVESQDCPQCYIRYLMEFPPIAASVNEVTLEIPDLVAVPSNTAPRDWKVQLKFKPADPAAIAPVIAQVVTPMPTDISTDAPTQSMDTYGITAALEKFVALPDGYILYGATSWTDSRVPPYGVASVLVSITDSTGADIPFDYADPGIFAAPGELREYWAYKIGINFTPPLKLTFGMLASLPADGGSFTFDPGPSPQMGQKWEINQDVTVNNEIVHVLTAEQGGIEPGFFLFAMQSDSNIIGASVIDLAHPP
ncbi:MAG: hypothetical protein IH588_08765, partial [Anaerolineales bacterium]|nr:hypothetical protein [Anaerolineales bacterium]